MLSSSRNRVRGIKRHEKRQWEGGTAAGGKTYRGAFQETK